MIHFETVNKTFASASGRRIILDRATFTVQTRQKLGILASAGSGKTTLANLMAGSLSCDSGRILTTGRICPPLGQMPGMDGKLNPLENLRYFSRLYQQDQDYTESLCKYLVADTAPFDRQLEACSAAFRARLAIAIAAAIPFDTYIIDERIPRACDSGFMKRVMPVLKHRFATASLIVLSCHLTVLRRYCDTYCVLSSGRLISRGSFDQTIQDTTYAA